MNYVKGPATSATPLHRLTENLTKAWLVGGVLRKMIADKMAKDYPSGAGVLSATMYLIAYVQPNGQVRELQPPFQRFARWQIANAPAHPECECQNWVDLEEGVPWRQHNRDRHHPMCAYRRVAPQIFNRFAAEQRAVGVANTRPDLLLRIEKEEEGG